MCRKAVTLQTRSRPAPGPTRESCLASRDRPESLPHAGRALASRGFQSSRSPGNTVAAQHTSAACDETRPVSCAAATQSAFPEGVSSHHGYGVILRSQTRIQFRRPGDAGWTWALERTGQDAGLDLLTRQTGPPPGATGRDCDLRGPCLPRWSCSPLPACLSLHPHCHLSPRTARSSHKEQPRHALCPPLGKLCPPPGKLPASFRVRCHPRLWDTSPDPSSSAVPLPPGWSPSCSALDLASHQTEGLSRRQHLTLLTYRRPRDRGPDAGRLPGDT